MLRIGLTGGIASGKSTVAQLFAALGVPIIDCDVIARELTCAGSPALSQIKAHFGKELIQPDANLKRTALRELIFKLPEERTWLEALLHPLIQEKIREQLSSLDTPYCLIVVPLLSESLAQGKKFDFIDEIWVVEASSEAQLQRLQERDSCSLEQAQSILAAQHSCSQRLKLADEIIRNEGNINSLQDQIRQLHERYKCNSL